MDIVLHAPLSFLKPMFQFLDSIYTVYWFPAEPTTNWPNQASGRIVRSCLKDTKSFYKNVQAIALPNRFSLPYLLS